MRISGSVHEAKIPSSGSATASATSRPIFTTPNADVLDQDPVGASEPDEHRVLELEHDPERGRDDERGDRERVLAHQVGELRRPELDSPDVDERGDDRQRAGDDVRERDQSTGLPTRRSARTGSARS